MRTTYMTLGALASLTAVLAACGGGGSGSSPAPATVVASAAPSLPGQTVNNFTGPSSKVTVSITVPKRKPASAIAAAHFHTLFGRRDDNKSLRTIANVSPSASIRTAGAALHQSSIAYEAAARRNPQYIPASTNYMEFVLSSGSNVLVDDTASCDSIACTASFTAPVGTGFTATLYLYDSCGTLLAAGTMASVNVALGVNAGITITLNGVVSRIGLGTDNSGPFWADPSQATTFNVTPVAYDYDDDVISDPTNPGVLIDSNFNQVASVQISQTGSDVTPSGTTTVNPNADNSFPSTAFAFAGTGSPQTISFSVNTTTGATGVVPAFNGCCSPGSIQLDYFNITDNQGYLSWSNPKGYPRGLYLATDPQFQTTGSGGGETDASIIFPVASNNATYGLALSSNIPGYNGNVTITANSCGSDIYSYPTSATPLATFTAPPFVQIQMQSNAPDNGNCYLLATDSGGRTAYLTFYISQTNLTIQNKARKH